MSGKWDLPDLTFVEDVLLIRLEVLEHFCVLSGRGKPHRARHCVAPDVYVLLLEICGGHENTKLLVPQNLRGGLAHPLRLGLHRCREVVVASGGRHLGHQASRVPVEHR